MLANKSHPEEQNDEKQVVNYEEIEVVKPLNKSKYEVYIAQAKGTKSYFAMKVYPFNEQNQPPSSFKRESRLASVTHPHIIKILDIKKERESILHGKEIKVSYILMELALYGDFADLLMNSKFPKDNTLIRTYFHQLIIGIEHLHSKRIAHMDLKLENLLLGKGFNLKIADFDCCYFEDDQQITTRGTTNFRAPEVKSKRCKNPKAADIYSAGIILFALKGGVLPYIEDTVIKGHNLFELLKTDDPTFWDAHNQCRDHPIEYDKSFRKLFTSMVKYDPEQRISLDEIKKSEWYQGPVYSQKELVFVMNKKAQGLTSVFEKKK